jgi:hypothetical protein
MTADADAEHAEFAGARRMCAQKIKRRARVSIVILERLRLL